MIVFPAENCLWPVNGSGGEMVPVTFVIRHSGQLRASLIALLRPGPIRTRALPILSRSHGILQIVFAHHLIHGSFRGSNTRHHFGNGDGGGTEEFVMGWKTPKFDYVNGYKIVELEGPTFKVFDRDRQIGDEFPYPGEAAAYANSLPKRIVQSWRDKP